MNHNRTSWLRPADRPDLKAVSQYLLCCIFVLLYAAWFLLGGEAQASQNKFRLQSSSINVAAGRSVNSNFSLASCIDPVMAGNSTSQSFRLQSGCGAAHATSYFEEGIPAVSRWSLILLTMTVLITTSLYLRNGNSNSG